jgi:hypothetical protein
MLDMPWKLCDEIRSLVLMGNYLTSVSVEKMLKMGRYLHPTSARTFLVREDFKSKQEENSSNNYVQLDTIQSMRQL